MARVIRSFSQVLSIGAGQLPAQGDATQPWWSADDTVGGAQALSVKASLNCATQGAGHWNTVVQAASAGSEGNSLKVALTGDSAAGTGVSVTFDDATSTVTVHFEPGVSTVAQVEAALAAVPAQTQKITVKTPGTGATVLVLGDAFVAASLAGGVSSEGHLTGGWHVDEAFLHFKPTAWGAITAVELVVQRSLNSALGGPWATIEPVLPASAISGRYVVSATGLLTIKDTLLAGEVVAIPLLVHGAERLRVGLRAADANSAAAFACVAGLELVQRGLYA